MRKLGSVEELNRLLGLLKYQVLTPRVTTMGICPAEGCGNSSRGSAICWECLIKEIVAAGIDEQRLRYWSYSAASSRNIMWDIEEQIENLGNKQTIENDDEKDLDVRLGG